MISAVPAPEWRVPGRCSSAAQLTALCVLGLVATTALCPSRARAAPEVESSAAEGSEGAAVTVTDAEPAAEGPSAATSTEAETSPDATSDEEEAAPEPETDEPEPEPETDEPEPEPETDEPETETDEPETDEPETIRPPRFDGPYVGVVAFGTVNFASVIDLDTPSPLFGTSGFIQAGDAVFPWMSIGIAAGGGGAWVGNQQMFIGALLVEFGFAPIKNRPLSIRAGFGFGGGAVDEPDVPRSGFGGALFKGSLRYEFFPLAERKRANRGGGWAIGPELGWLGATPAGPDQPYVNTVTLGLSTSFYFGS